MTIQKTHVQRTWAAVRALLVWVVHSWLRPPDGEARWEQ